VFMLYGVVLGLLAGWLLGGRLEALTTIRFHWPWLAVGALLVQVVLFSAPVTSVIGDVGALPYVASSAAVLVVVLRNITIPGLAIVAVGAASNLTAIVANGGFMPASPSALAALGRTIGPDYSNSREYLSPALAPLTDIFAMPRWIPFANLFSVGDVLISVGIFVAIVMTMRSGRAVGAPAPDHTTHTEPGAARQLPPTPRPE
jgi:hypothetical protein